MGHYGLIKLFLALLVLALEVIRDEVCHDLLLHLSVATNWLPALTVVCEAFSPQGRHFNGSYP